MPRRGQISSAVTTSECMLSLSRPVAFGPFPDHYTPSMEHQRSKPVPLAGRHSKDPQTSIMAEYGSLKGPYRPSSDVE